jgi:hypothetical protein
MLTATVRPLPPHVSRHTGWLPYVIPTEKTPAANADVSDGPLSSVMRPQHAFGLDVLSSFRVCRTNADAAYNISNPHWETTGSGACPRTTGCGYPLLPATPRFCRKIDR